MNYSEGKDIMIRLQKGLETNQAAKFIKIEEEHILRLISSDLVKPTAFVHANKIRFGAQNMAEPAPMTNKGKQLFGLV